MKTGFYEAEADAVNLGHSFPEFDTALLLSYSTSQRSHRGHPDSREWRNRVCNLSGERQGHVVKRYVEDIAVAIFGKYSLP